MHLLRPHRRVGRALAMSSRLAARPTSCRRGSEGRSGYLTSKDKETTMPELLVDFIITSLDGYASAEGWPGFWGLRGLSTSRGSTSNRMPRS
jgi:hypothetical protein